MFTAIAGEPKLVESGCKNTKQDIAQELCSRNYCCQPPPNASYS